LFLDTGMGKSICELEFATQGAEATNGRSLILTPLVRSSLATGAWSAVRGRLRAHVMAGLLSGGGGSAPLVPRHLSSSR